MIVYSRNITPRLRFIMDFFAGEMSGGEWTITTNKAEFISSSDAKINYSDAHFDTRCLKIIPNGLLFETVIQPQQIICTGQDGYKVFFKNQSDTGFDIFAASFYLLSRYEEYLPHPKDKFGRFSHESSLAFKEGFLQQPLINVWAGQLKKIISKKFPSCNFTKKSISFLPTYDIDMAWSYRNKGFLRNAGNLVKDFFSFRFKHVLRRLKVLSGMENDPFDTFAWLNSLHEKHRIEPFYFFLVAEKVSVKDKNISPHHSAMRKLIAEHASRYQIGLHPSWQSFYNKNILRQEKDILEKIAGKTVTASRQHYIKLDIPRTYNELADAGLLYDYSMGYPAANGFRASVASPFKWYDLKKEAVSPLTIFPFCFMEGNSAIYQKQTPEEGLQELLNLYSRVQAVDGFFCMIWHNSSLTNEAPYKAWRDIYEKFIVEISASEAYRSSYPERSWPYPMPR